MADRVDLGIEFLQVKLGTARFMILQAPMQGVV